MENNALVSIALCTYNGAQYLKSQLDTLISQTYKNIEIIVVDDCSTDETYSILQGYAALYPNFKIWQNEINLGFAANFERAVRYCTGEYIALCDQDDLWHPRKIELQANAIGDNIFVYHDSEFVDENGVSMNKKTSDIMNFYRGSQPEVFLFSNCVSGHTILMKKELLDDALPLKTAYFHDWWLAYVATNVGTIDFIPQCLVQYRQHAKSDTNILRMNRKNNKYKHSSVEKLERSFKWIEHCASFTKNRNPELINQFYQAFKKRTDSYVSFGLSVLLYKYRKTIFHIRKKSKLNMLNFIYSQIWGLKTKRLFNNL